MSATTPISDPVTQVSPPVRPANGLVVGLAVALSIALLVIAVLATTVVRGTGNDDARTVSVTGEATLTDVPDQYVFYPAYTFENTSKDAALADVSKKSEEVVAGLKKVGVADKDIKTNSNGYDTPRYPEPIASSTSGTSNYSLQLTVTVRSKDLVQKVQDYLVSTSPMGTISPQASFSDAKRKDLQSKARDQATKDARSKAEQSAKNLGFKVGKVQSVSDGSGFDTGVYSDVKLAEPAMAAEGNTTSSSLAVQPGENQLNYSVSVVYQIR